MRRISRFGPGFCPDKPIPVLAPRIVGYHRDGRPIFEMAGGDEAGTPTLLERIRARRDEVDGQARAIVDAADVENREITEEELDQVRDLNGQGRALQERWDEVNEVEQRRRASTENDPTPPGDRHVEPVRTGDEPRTYSPQSPHSFFVDAFRSQHMGDTLAAERLARHTREVQVDVREKRDVVSTAFGGLIVPQYLVGEFAEVLRNGRSFANAVRRLPLPAEGLVLVIPRGETGVTVAPQATQNTAVSETDVDYDNDLSINVRTFAGQQDVSRQTLERGTPGIDQLLYSDLVGAYAARLDSSILNDDGTAGTHKSVRSATGVNTTTYTDGTPTVTEVWPKLADAVQKVATNRKLSADMLVMHPRRWGWFIAAVDSQGRPLVVHGDQSAAVNAMGAAAADFGEGQLVGTLQGLPVLVDANMATNVGAGTEDVILAVRRKDPILWEVGNGMPRELRFEDVGSATLTVKLLVYGYSAFTAERFPTAITVISGTGLIAPTF